MIVSQGHFNLFRGQEKGGGESVDAYCPRQIIFCLPVCTSFITARYIYFVDEIREYRNPVADQEAIFSFLSCRLPLPFAFSLYGLDVSIVQERKSERERKREREREREGERETK